MTFYKVVDPNVLSKIDAFYAELYEFTNKLDKFLLSIGVEHAVRINSLRDGNGVKQLFVESKNVAAVDQEKWRVSKSNDARFSKINPRKGNKEFYQLYTDNIPSEPFSYDPLLALIIQGVYEPFLIGGLTIEYKYGSYFLFKTESYQVQDGIDEIQESEFHQIIEAQKAA